MQKKVIYNLGKNMKKGSILSLGSYSNHKFLTDGKDYKFIEGCGFTPLNDFKYTYIKTDYSPRREELDWLGSSMSYFYPFG